MLMFSYVSVFLWFWVWVFLYHFTLPRVYFLPARVVLVTVFSHPQQRVVSTHTTRKFPLFIPFQPPFHYACLTNYSSLIPQFSQLQQSSHNTVLSYSHIHTIAHLPASLPPPKTHTHTHTHTQTPAAPGSKFPKKL